MNENNNCGTEIVTCKECVYSFDEVDSQNKVHCCRHKKSMENTNTCEDGRKI